MFERLLQPGEQVEFPASGSHLRIDQGSQIYIKTSNNETANLNVRETAIFRPFNAVTVTNVGPQAETVKIRVSTAMIIAADDGAEVEVTNLPIQLDRVMVNAWVDNDEFTPIYVNILEQPPISVSATVNQSNTITPLADVSLTAVTPTVIVAANVNRKELLVKNPSSNAASIRIGSATVGAAKGFELEPGESTILTTTAAVYGYSAPGETVSVTELEFV